MSRSIAPTAERDELTARAPLAAERREEERRTALRLLTHTLEGEQPISLPTLATAGDVREVVQYLKKKPAGVSIVEAMDDVKRRVFEPRKVAAYEFWGVVDRSGDRLQLSPLGWEFARKLEPETEAYRAVLDNTAPYRSALEWMHRQNLELVTHTDIAAFWQELYSTTLEQNEKTMEGNVVCFFHLCQAAELGTVTIGKRGQPARLRVERDELDGYIGEGRRSPSPLPPLKPASDAETGQRFAALAPKSNGGARPHSTATNNAALRLLISSGVETKLVRQIQTALELADIESQTIGHATPDAAFVSEEVSQAMRRCEAALIILTPDECQPTESGECLLRQNVLVQIGTAFVLYDRRVVLLWHSHLPAPANLRELPHLSFESEDLTWDVGVKLLKAVKDFQASARQESRR